MTRVGILETGYPSDVIRSRYGKFSDMFIRYFDKQDDLKFSVYPVFNNTPVPASSDQDAWIITGSLAAVYEDHNWLPPLREFVKQVVEQNIPIIGVCLGHQLMAQTFGSKVEKSNKGRGLGIHQYVLSDAGKKLVAGTSTLNLPVTHQDQVVELPPHATLLASSDFCSYAALAYGKSAVSFQGHPEFTIDCAQDVARLWISSNVAPSEIVEKIESTFRNIPSDSARLAPILGQFLRGEKTLGN